MICLLSSDHRGTVLWATSVSLSLVLLRAQPAREFIKWGGDDSTEEDALDCHSGTQAQNQQQLCGGRQ